MRNTLRAVLAVSSCVAGQALADPSPQDILSENRAAMGGDAWLGEAALQLDYDYRGQGLTGHTSSLENLQGPGFLDRAEIGPQRTASGFDGVRAWEQEPSGTITEQGGGDVRALAVNEAYRDRNGWWAEGYGGARITALGVKVEADRRYDVLSVAPSGGEPFEAWFDAETHLLARTVELQGSLTVTTYFEAYAPFDGALIAHTQVIDDGTGAANRQTLTLAGARFLPAEPPTAFTAPAQDLHDFALAGGVHETTVPFRLINNHIYADVSVNDRGPLQFLFDTGGHDILTPATATALNVRVSGSMTTAGAGESTAQSGVATVRSIRVGAAIITDQPVAVLQFDRATEGVEEQGMIGYEFFARFVTRIDYGHHTLSFIDPASFDPKDAGTPVPFRFYHQFPEIEGSYDGIPGRFGIDTGARTTLSLTGPFVRAHDLRSKTTAGIAALTGWGVGGESRAFVARGGVLMLGDVTIDHPLTELSLDKGGAGAAEAFPNNVGGGVLKRFVVTLDYAHYRIFLKPIEGPIADLDTFDRSGMWLNVKGDAFEVVDVTKDGPAEEAGVKAGDLILSVDGKPATSLPLADLRLALRNETPGTAVTLTVKTEAGTRPVTIRLRDLV